MTPRMVAFACLGGVLVGSGWLHAAGRNLPTAVPFDQLEGRPSTSTVASGFLWANRLLTSVTRQRPASSPSASRLEPTSTERYQAVLGRYCVSCHNERLRTGNLSLDQTDLQRIDEGAEVWEKVLHKLQTREMPPAGRPRPDEATYQAFASWLGTSLDEVALAHPNPGRTAAVHRLNRAEYTNVIRDLLAVDIDGRSFLPGDDASYGFDNIGDVLTLSQPLLERYLSAAQKISRLAVGDVTVSVVEETYATSRNYRQDDRMNNELPFGSRGGMVVRHYFPVDGEYSIRVEPQRTVSGRAIKGLRAGGYYGRESTGEHEIHVRLDGQLIETFTIGRPVSADETEETEETEPEVQVQIPPLVPVDLVVRVPVTAGPHAVAVMFPQASGAPDGFQLPLPTRSYSYNNDRGGLPAVGSVIIGGPYDVTGPGDSPSRQRIFVCRPTDTSDADRCATTILSTLARRAYRRPVADEDVEPLLGAYQSRRLAGGDFGAGIQAGLAAILVSPNFLFRVEREPAESRSGAVYPISDLERASRLPLPRQ